MRIEKCKCSKCCKIPVWSDFKYSVDINENSVREASFYCPCGHKEESVNIMMICQEWLDTGRDVKKIKSFLENNLGQEWVSK